jgi:hypothetical protein
MRALPQASANQTYVNLSEESTPQVAEDHWKATITKKPATCKFIRGMHALPQASANQTHVNLSEGCYSTLNMLDQHLLFVSLN